MPQVQVKLWIEALPEVVYDALKDMESYPSFMENLKSVRVLERCDSWTLTQWETEVAGRNWSWTELDQFDDLALRIKYEQKSGDLAQFEGYWQVTPEKQGSLVELVTIFDLGIPMLGDLLNPVLKQVLQANCLSMLQAFKRQFES